MQGDKKEGGGERKGGKKKKIKFIQSTYQPARAPLSRPWNPGRKGRPNLTSKDRRFDPTNVPAPYFEMKRLIGEKSTANRKTKKNPKFL
jgi:hypothetical protein